MPDFPSDLFLNRRNNGPDYDVWLPIEFADGLISFIG